MPFSESSSVDMDKEVDSEADDSEMQNVCKIPNIRSETNLLYLVYCIFWPSNQIRYKVS